MTKKFEVVHSKKCSRGPKVKPSTVRIYKSGVARLSPDLAIAKRFLVSVADGVIQLQASRTSSGGTYKTWMSRVGAKSPLISLVAPMKQLGYTKFSGSYKASVVGQAVRIFLNKKVA